MLDGGRHATLVAVECDLGRMGVPGKMDLKGVVGEHGAPYRFPVIEGPDVSKLLVLGDG